MHPKIIITVDRGLVSTVRANIEADVEVIDLDQNEIEAADAARLAADQAQCDPNLSLLYP